MMTRKERRESLLSLMDQRRAAGAKWKDVAAEVGLSTEALWGMRRRAGLNKQPPITDREIALLKFVEKYQRKHAGVTPNFREIAVALGLKSKSSISDAITALERTGYIRRLRDRARAIEILRPASGGKTPPFEGAIPIYDARTHEIRGWLA
jgi:hypothetical protein